MGPGSGTLSIDPYLLPRTTMPLEQWLERMRFDRHNLVGRPTPEAAIEELAADLGVALPASYVTLLRAFDGAELPFGRVYAITEQGAGFFQLGAELDDFFEAHPELEGEGLLPFGDDYGGASLCFDLDSDPDDPAIVLVDSEPEPLAANLLALIVEAEAERAQEARRDTLFLCIASALDGLVVGEARLSRAFDAEPAFRSDTSLPLERFEIVYDDIAAVGPLIDKVLAQSRGPVHLITWSDGEMSSDPRWRVPVGDLVVGGRTHQLYFGDRIVLRT